MLIAIAVAFTGGVVLGYFVEFDFGGWVAWVSLSLMVFAALAGAFGLWRMGLRRAWFVPLVVLVALIGFVRVGTADTDIGTDWFNIPADGQAIVAEGALLTDATRAGSDDFLVRLSVERVAVQTDGELVFEDADFLLFVFTERVSADSGRSFDEFKYGDRYRVSGDFRVAEAGADFAGSLNSQISSLVSADGGSALRRGLANVREAISQQIANVVAGDVEGLAAAMLVGDRKRLSSEVTESFRSAGLAHILAISGFHISLIGGAVFGLAILLFGRRFGIYILATFVAIWIYAALAGLSPSVTRAAIMFSVFLAARLLGRQNNILPAVGLAAIIMIAISPEIIVSVSFQLSFAAVLGIALFTTQVNQLWWQVVSHERAENNVFLRIANYAIIGLSTSIGATLFTAPIVLATFGQTALSGPIATLLVAPFLPFFVFPLMVALVLSLIWAPLGAIAGFVGVVAGEYILVVASAFAGARWLVVQVENLPLYIGAVYYAVLAVVVFYRPIVSNLRYELRGFRLAKLNNFPVLITCVIVLAFSWGALASVQEERLVRVYFPQTTVGDLVLIETPSGFQMVIDGARRRDEAVEALTDILPFWDNAIDMVVLTHHDADHIGGLAAVIDKYEVDYILDSTATHDSLLAQEWEAKLTSIRADGEIVVQKAAAGMTIDVGDGVVFEVLWDGFPADIDPVPPINDYSTVIRMVYGDFSVLLTGDITSPVEQTLAAVESDLQSTVLKVAHHGSKTSSSPAFLAATNPQVAVIQAGYRNPFGHPNSEVVARIEGFLPPASADMPRLLSTNAVGDVAIFSNGSNLIIELGNNVPQDGDEGD